MKIAYPNTINNPKNESGLEYCIRITENALPNTDGRNESIRSQLPQQPNGTREKNEKNELIAVLPELASIPLLLFVILQLKFFL